MPALYSLAFRGLLPESFAIVGAARTEETDEQFRERMKQAVQDARARPVRRGGLGRARGRDALRRRSTSPTTKRRGRAARHADASSTRSAARRATASTTSRCRRARSATLVDEIARAARRRGLDPADHREAVRPRPRVGARAERRDPASTSPSTRSSASTTTSARRRCRTCWRCGSRTASSSRSGTGSSSTTCRSRSPSRSGSRAAPASTSRRARSATSSRTTCCSSSRSRRWSRRSTSPPTRCATRR